MKIDVSRLADQREVVLAEDWDAELLDTPRPTNRTLQGADKDWPLGHSAQGTPGFSPGGLHLNAPGCGYAGLLHLEAAVVKDAGLIRAQVRIQARTTLVCSRCLKEFDGSFDKKLNLVYSVDLSNKTLVLDDDVRGELILDCPQKILCRQDCKGLCSRCGVDLNEKKCKCSV